VVNKSNRFAYSTMKATSEPAFIDQFGFYGIGLKWAGNMGTQRIGDLLPYEYQPEMEANVNPPDK